MTLFVNGGVPPNPQPPSAAFIHTKINREIKNGNNFENFYIKNDVNNIKNDVNNIGNDVEILHTPVLPCTGVV